MHRHILSNMTDQLNILSGRQRLQQTHGLRETVHEVKWHMLNHQLPCFDF